MHLTEFILAYLYKLGNFFRKFNLKIWITLFNIKWKVFWLLFYFFCHRNDSRTIVPTKYLSSILEFCFYIQHFQTFITPGLKNKGGLIFFLVLYITMHWTEFYLDIFLNIGKLFENHIWIVLFHYKMEIFNFISLFLI